MQQSQESTHGASERVLIISSDGHATARMPDYKPYLPATYHAEFDEFCELYARQGSRNFDAPNLLRRTDVEVVDEWTQRIVDNGRLEGNSDPTLRLKESERDGVAAEVLFPDFGLPFELYSPFLAAAMGFSRTPEQVDVGNRAFNRWLADFCNAAPGRFAGMASVSFHDVDAALIEIRAAREAGLHGIVLPMFDEARPVFDPAFEPIWALLEELDMPVNSHTGTSSAGAVPLVPPVPHPTCALPIFSPQLFFQCRQILSHLIWGGVLERHPRLKVAFTEQGSGWVVGQIQSMDYTYEGSFLRRDIRDVVRMKPSEYFRRQCWLGSSIFSLAEIEARHDIGVDKIALGMDYPHHEGTWALTPAGTIDYLQATLGVARVTAAEARAMLSENVAALWGFDIDRLRPIADKVGPSMVQVLAVPTENLFPRGDVNKPLAAAVF